MSEPLSREALIAEIQEARRRLGEPPLGADAGVSGRNVDAIVDLAGKLGLEAAELQEDLDFDLQRARRRGVAMPAIPGSMVERKQIAAVLNPLMNTVHAGCQGRSRAHRKQADNERIVVIHCGGIFKLGVCQFSNLYTHCAHPEGYSIIATADIGDSC